MQVQQQRKTVQTTQKIILWGLVVVGMVAGGCASRNRVKALPRRTTLRTLQLKTPGAPAPAQPAPAPAWLKEKRLSLGKCVWLALRNNPRVRSSWERVRAASDRVGQSKASYFPQIDLRAGSERRQTQVPSDVEPKYLRTLHSARFSVSQLLLDGGARKARLAAARAEMASGNWQHDSTLLNVALETEVAYYQLLAAKALRTLEQENVRRRAYHLNRAQKRYEVGLGRDLAVSEAKAQHADALLRHVEARNEVRLRRGQLAAVMGLLPSVPFEIEDLPDSLREQHMEDADALLKEAAAKRPSLLSAAAEITRIRRQLDAERAERWPRLSASAEYGWRDTHILPEEKDEWALGINLTWPLFTGLDRTYRIREAKAQLRRAQAEYETLLRSVELEVWTAYSQLLRADEAMTAADIFLDSATKNVQMAEKAYSAGKATTVELIDAQATFVRASSRRIGTRLDWHMALVRLERAVGRSWQSEAEASAPPPAPQPDSQPEAGAHKGGVRK